MTPERKERILQIADELEAQGLPATNSAVYARALGHRGDVTQVMKARRAERGGAVAVLEEEPEEPEEPTPTAAELQEDLEQLVNTYESWHLALERVWQLEQEGPLSEANFSRKQWLGYKMVQNIQAQERLRPQLVAAQALEALGVAVAHHDALVEAVTALVLDGLQRISALKAWRQDLAALLDDQQHFLTTLTKPDGQPAFDLTGGDMVLQQMLSTIPGGMFLVQYLFSSTIRGVSEGDCQTALDYVPGSKRFSPTMIHRFQEGYTHASDL